MSWSDDPPSRRRPTDRNLIRQARRIFLFAIFLAAGGAKRVLLLLARIASCAWSDAVTISRLAHSGLAALIIDPSHAVCDSPASSVM